MSYDVRFKNPLYGGHSFEYIGDVRLCTKVLEEKYGRLITIRGEREKLKRWQQRLDDFITGGGS